MKELIIKEHRTGYRTSQCGRTLTVGELIEYLEQFEDDRPVYLSNGFTFGSITEDDFSDEDGDE